ncbi:MAG: response regulator, partial [Bacteroidota bacterium]
EAGMLDLEAHPFDIRQCVEEALDLVAQPAAEKGVELAYLIEDGVPAIVQSDVTRVRQVLVNLLSNAVKFTPDGSVCVRVSSESRDVTTGSLATVYFAVEDTGIGIADDKLDAIFESFSQADASTTRRFGGTGLGLTICRRLVTMMGGALDVESQPGAGSTFRFSIQAEVAPSERRVFLRRDQPELEGRRVLIVDDNDVNLEILTRLATRWRMPSTQVRSGPLALAAVETAIDAGEPYDLVLLDMQMPEMDGLEVARGLRRIGTRTGSMPVIVMLTSIHREGRFRQEARAAGVQWVLYKPTKPSQLYDTLIGAFGGQASLSSAARAGDKPATAWVARPRASADGASGPGEASPLRILLAEDNAVNQKVALRLLGRLGYSADVVADGAEAVEAVARMDAHNEPYDVVLMDVQMPVMDGHEATRRIRTATLKRQPWVVALTANAMQGDREACLEAGADDYLAKPVQLDTMGEALERANSASVPNPTPAEA